MAECIRCFNGVYCGTPVEGAGRKSPGSAFQIDQMHVPGACDSALVWNPLIENTDSRRLITRWRGEQGKEDALAGRNVNRGNASAHDSAHTLLCLILDMT